MIENVISAHEIIGYPPYHVVSEDNLKKITDLLESIRNHSVRWYNENDPRRPGLGKKVDSIIEILNGIKGADSPNLAGDVDS